MSTVYRIDTRLGVVFTQCRETISDSDVARHLSAIAHDSAFSPAYAHLIDCSEVTSFKVTPNFIHSVAREKLFSSHAKCAIVAPQNYIYGMARMFQMQQRGILEVFRDLNAAESWLGIGATHVPAAVQAGASATTLKSIGT
jgi:hypothetical protein